ncbi:ArsR/SmtB family transcription factor [Fodinibius sediminis]|uniref:Transcriptional regulator, ArsR family n=1 Tax=Fodinibius sediminis TaxID=1214077 RepID=A0A521E5U0_9BACT|nr:metalloregulator ArsR/SmtB family transcription factor [Fodinibius sediminis]SMO79313.1 transcriptional regulator, ArsR family [Fodinibius sediminis]
MSTDQLSNTFSALADPTRRAILAQLTTGQKTVSDLAEPFDMTMPAITKHLKVLEKAGLVERSREAQYRPCHLRPDPLREIDQWMEQYREFFEVSFDRLDNYLQQLQAKEENNDD